MSADKEALSPGADLWVIENNPNNNWWNFLDIKSGFLLSNTLLFRATSASSKIQEIIELIEMPTHNNKSKSESILLGTSHHFHNKWLYLVPNYQTATLEEIAQALKTLNGHGVRLFNCKKDTAASLKSRLSASLGNITYIE